MDELREALEIVETTSVSRAAEEDVSVTDSIDDSRWEWLEAYRQGIGRYESEEHFTGALVGFQAGFAAAATSAPSMPDLGEERLALGKVMIVLEALHLAGGTALTEEIARVVEVGRAALFPDYAAGDGNPVPEVRAGAEE